MNSATLLRQDQPLSRGTYSPERYSRGMLRLVQAVQELSLARDLPQIQKIVRKAARELTGCDGATFVLRDNGHCYYADEDAIAPLWKGKRFPLEMCISGWAMINRKPAVIPDIYVDARIPHDAYRPTFVNSLVMVPIRSLDPIGAIGNYWADSHPVTQEEVELLQSLADSTAIAMENVQIFGELEERVRMRTAELQSAKEAIELQSLTDELTGINNRRGFQLQAVQALAWIERRQQPCALAFIDVDGLKRVNDQLGHETGDALIADMASLLRSTCRDADIVGRLGGDEFCVLLLNPEGGGKCFAARLQASIERYNESKARPYRLSASVGIVDAEGAKLPELDDLMARADEQMYAQKRSRPGTRMATVMAA